MQFNHYYKELGLKETDFPFKKDKDIFGREVENKEGFSEEEFFNLDYSLALYIYGRLRYFQDNCLKGCPMNMSMEQWNSIIKKMIKAFRLYIEKGETDYTVNEIERKIISKNKTKQINYGMRLFIKYFGCLWY